MPFRSNPAARDWLPKGITPEDIDAVVAGLTQAEAAQLEYESRFWWRGFLARPAQLMPPGRWSNWLVCAGRGFGKTRLSAEAVRELVTENPGSRIALIGPTAADVRDVMVEGESGLLSVFPEYDRPQYESSKRRVSFRNGSMAFLYSAEEPERLRGPQHSFAAVDEIAAFKDVEALWSNLKFGLRLGKDPRVIVTTTPKPSNFLRRLMDDPHTVVTRGSTFDNAANLPGTVLEEFRRVYSGTRLGEQELLGRLLEQAEGALWSRQRLEECRVRKVPESLVRIVVAIDPSVTANANSDECGIVVCGMAADGHGYVLEDASGKMAPDVWARKAIELYDNWDADKIIAETNNGGDLVSTVLKTIRPNVSYAPVTASRGKLTRAEPIASLSEQSKVHMVNGHPKLEDELTSYEPGVSFSPNRLDAMVWGLSYLMLKPVRIGKAFWV